MQNKKIIPVSKAQRTQEYWKVLNNVLDPEVGVGIVDLGLVYNVEIVKGLATVTMTLTSMGCPLGPQIMDNIVEELEQYPGVVNVSVKLVWDPIWNKDMIDPDIKAMLFS